VSRFRLLKGEIKGFDTPSCKTHATGKLTVLN